MTNPPVRLFLAVFNVCALIAIWLIGSLPAATADDSNVFYSLVQDAQQWQDANPGKCGQDTSTCGVQKMVQLFQSCSAFRVVNGCPIGDQTVYGWQVGVVLAGALCSGTLVSPTHVVCAAHCVKALSSNDVGRITVYIGPKTLRNAQSVQKFSVSRFAANPAYDSDVIVNDASIIELSSPVNFGDQNGVRAACLATRPVPRTLSSLIVGGYGIDDYKKHSGAGTLRYTVLSVAPDATCSALYGADQYNSTSTFCAIGQRAKLSTDSCNGDSGSAVMSKSASGVWQLIGIVSYGTAKCSTAPGVYSDAFNVGIRASTAAVTRVAKENKKGVKDDACDARKLRRRPEQGKNRPIVGANGKKIGGIGATIVETIRVHGCKSNSNCMSNVCRQIEACHTLHGGTGLAAGVLPPRDDELNPEEAQQFRSAAGPVFTSIVERPVKPINEAVAEAERPSLFRRQCTKLNVCWLPAWIETYTTTPVFDFDTIIEEDEE